MYKHVPILKGHLSYVWILDIGKWILDMISGGLLMTTTCKQLSYYMGTTDIYVSLKYNSTASPDIAIGREGEGQSVDASD